MILFSTWQVIWLEDLDKSCTWWQGQDWTRAGAESWWSWARTPGQWEAGGECWPGDHSTLLCSPCSDPWPPLAPVSLTTAPGTESHTLCWPGLGAETDPGMMTRQSGGQCGDESVDCGAETRDKCPGVALLLGSHHATENLWYQPEIDIFINFTILLLFFEI